MQNSSSSISPGCVGGRCVGRRVAPIPVPSPASCVNAIEKLINELLKCGAEKHRLQAKLFGGARMSANLSDIGRQNAAFTHNFLANEGISIASESVGGLLARRVIFRPTTGQVKLLFVQSNELELNEVP